MVWRKYLSSTYLSLTMSLMAAMEMWYVLTNNHNAIIGGSCHKYHFCRDKYLFCRGKRTFVATKHVFRRDKSILVATNTCLQFCRGKHTYVATKDVLSRQAYFCCYKTLVLSRQKWYLWQLPPIIQRSKKKKKKKKSHTVDFLLFLQYIASEL